MAEDVKIKDTLYDFLRNHPEITVIRNYEGKISYVFFPEEATQTSYTIVNDIVEIHYVYNGESINFPEFVDQLNDN